MRTTSYNRSVTNSLKFTHFIAAATLAVMLFAANAEAAARPTEQVRKEFEQSFQAVLKNPTDVKETLHYAHLAVELKDYESAIPPLERVLMYNPNLPQVRLEVGVMYYNLKSSDMARTYLTQVKNDPAASDAVKARATSYLAKL